MKEVCGGWAKRVMSIKEGTCDEHWVLYVSDESLNPTPETNITLTGIFKKLEEKKEIKAETALYVQL